MWKLILICGVAMLANVDAANTKTGKKSTAEGAAKSTQSKRQAYSGAGSYAGAGTGGYSGGYVGGYSGAGGGYGNYAGTGGFAGGYAGDYNDFGDYGNTAFGLSAGAIDPYEFHQRLTSNILAQHAAQNQAQFAQQQAFFDAVRRQSHYHNDYNPYKTNRYAPNYAAASGSYGPDGFYQSAHISPPNPAIPNIHNRFSTSSSSSPAGGTGYKGISTSSFSSSADINGKRQNVQGAQTTVNDNGKITTYRVHN